MITDDEKLTQAFNHLIKKRVVLPAYNEDRHVLLDRVLHLVLRSNFLSEHDVLCLLSACMLFGLTFGIDSQMHNNANCVTIVLKAYNG